MTEQFEISAVEAPVWDFDCGRRQGFGTRFTRTPQDTELSIDLAKGRLSMAPHASWHFGEQVDWTADPFRDNNWKFQLHSLRWLDVLRREYFEHNDPSLRSLWLMHVKNWLELNLTADGKWAWNDMATALRTMELCFGLSMFPEGNSDVQDAIVSHSTWLCDPDNLHHGNHLLHQNAALFIAARTQRSRRLTTLALNRINAYFETAYDFQGVNEEGSWGYQDQNLRWSLEVRRRLELENVPIPPSMERLTLTPLALAHATRPDGQLVRIGDTDGGAPSAGLSAYTDFARTCGREGKAPEETCQVLEQGYFFARSSWGRTADSSGGSFITACFGSQSKIHGHADGGSLTYYNDGVQWLDDNGKYAYGGDSFRVYLLSRSAHNAIEICNRPIDKSLSVELVDRYDDGNVVRFNMIDPCYVGVLIERTITYIRSSGLVCVDDWVTAATAVDIALRWHTGLGVEMEKRSDRTVQLSKSSAGVDLAWDAPELEARIRRGVEGTNVGWTSVGWRRRMPIDVLELMTNSSSLHVRTTLSPSIGSF